ncbi:LysR family transcriptional regulator [Bordetella genomosp. 1]|uniref:LysR family transcriptional regulator n=1 Tax=Bordetella genomosp. 1 TaxID=1395607 RepID=A0A261SE75_9BORD|nr:LysR family transcriptional regulator [Bordetella genomosp. 1]MDQ8031630.1 LysR family transcriptional regulator [Bordetella sp.]OZI35455.1 LysR family transcriptional regulator [Bordetella genomosp. 1]OZI63998.1 LysR family transcriptional regulator [Bordetella genomosp. 1]
MHIDLNDLNAFVAVARAGGFREAARLGNTNPSRLSDALRRVEARLGVRLLHRTTRSVSLTEAGRNLLARLDPALSEMEAAIDTFSRSADQPAGTLRLNVSLSASRLVLPALVPPFLAEYPDIRLDVVAEESFVDILAEGCDAGIRYGESLEQDMIALPIGPRVQRFAAAASPAYLARHGTPRHPRDLMQHACLRGRFPSGAMPPWEFERNGERHQLEPTGPLVVRIGGAVDLAIDAACAGTGIVYLFEDWLRPQFDAGTLVPVLPKWWPSFPGPYLYYSGRRFTPAPLRAFVEFVRRANAESATMKA